MGEFFNKEENRVSTKGIDTSEVKKYNLIRFMKLYYEDKSIDINIQGSEDDETAVCCCPLHKEKTPSFNIRRHPNGDYSYKCFGCDAGGDIMNLVMDDMKMPFIPALKKIKEITGLDIRFKKPNKMHQEYTSYTQGMQDRYKELLTEIIEDGDEDERVGYLKGRGFWNRDLLDTFGIGFVPADEYDINKVTDVNDRISIPLDGMSAYSDEFMGFTYRTVMDKLDPTSWKVINEDRIENGKRAFPKYTMSVNSNNVVVDGDKGYYGDIYKKDNYIWNMSRAYPYIRHQGEVIIVEGAFDLMSLYKVGVRNVLSTFTCHVSNTILKEIATITKVVTFWYDADKAGLANLAKYAIKLRELGCTMYVFSPQDFNGDPDEYVNKADFEPGILKDALRLDKVEGFRFIRERRISIARNRIYNLKLESLREIEQDLKTLEDDTFKREVLELARKELN